MHQDWHSFQKTMKRYDITHAEISARFRIVPHGSEKFRICFHSSRRGTPTLIITHHPLYRGVRGVLLFSILFFSFLFFVRTREGIGCILFVFSAFRCILLFSFWLSYAARRPLVSRWWDGRHPSVSISMELSEAIQQAVNPFFRSASVSQCHQACSGIASATSCHHFHDSP